MSKHLFAFFVIGLIWVCSGCTARQRLPLPVDITEPATHGAQQVIAILYRDEQGSRLVNSLTVSADRPLPLDTPPQQVWLGAIDPSDEVVLRTVGSVQYGFVVAQGRWLSAGRYGPGGAWSYALESPRLQAFEPETVDLAALLRDNRYEGIIVRVQATLIVASGTSLLVDAIGPGGVPVSTARQIKVLYGERDEPLLERLEQSGLVRYGSVEVIGRWQQGRLEPLLITPLP
ncbi:hypothetical protein [Chloroflexus sp.]